MWSPVGMNCCSPQQEALLFSSSGSSTFGCLYMLDSFLVHGFRMKLKYAHFQLLASTQAVSQVVAVPLAPLTAGGEMGR